MSYAPVLISVYTRDKHLKKCLDSLRKCRGAEKTDVYIVSDAAAVDKDVQAVKRVREIIKKQKGFRSLSPIIRKNNKGFPSSILQAIDKVFSKHSKLIFLEDDVCVSKGFLEFTNAALNKYESNPKVRAVCGWSWASLKNDKENHYFFRGFSAWGAGIWKKKMYPFHDIFKIGAEFGNSLRLLRKANRIMPNTIDFVNRLGIQKCPIYDIAWSLWLIKKDCFSVFPSKNLIRNIGHDGSGVHCTWAPWVEKQTLTDQRFDCLSDIPVRETSKHRKASIEFHKPKTFREILRQYRPALPFLRLWVDFKAALYR